MLGLCCVCHPNKAQYVNSIANLNVEDQQTIMEILEKKVLFFINTDQDSLEEVKEIDEDNDIIKIDEEINIIKRNDEDMNRENKMRMTIDYFQNENIRICDENKGIKKKNVELIEQIKSLLTAHDARFKERTQNYDELEEQIRIKEFKFNDLQNKLEQQIKTHSKEIWSLEVFDKLYIIQY